MSYLWRILICLSVCILTDANDRIHFEENIQDKSKLPADGRLPLLNYKGCDENEMFYPGDQGGDWICDCKPAYIYVAEYEKCYPIYAQGPCEPGSYIYLDRNMTSAYCKPNPCGPHGKILYNAQCIKLGEKCGDQGFYGIDDVTLDILCMEPAKRETYQENEKYDTTSNGQKTLNK